MNKNNLWHQLFSSIFKVPMLSPSTHCWRRRGCSRRWTSQPSSASSWTSWSLCCSTGTAPPAWCLWASWSLFPDQTRTPRGPTRTLQVQQVAFVPTWVKTTWIKVCNINHLHVEHRQRLIEIPIAFDFFFLFCFFHAVHLFHLEWPQLQIPQTVFVWVSYHPERHEIGRLWSWRSFSSCSVVQVFPEALLEVQNRA